MKVSNKYAEYPEKTKDGWPRWNSPANAEVSLRKLMQHGYRFEAFPRRNP